MSTALAPSPTEAVNLDGGGAVLLREVRQAQVSPTGPDKPFAILRYAKLRSARSITGSSQHMRRLKPTPNADPARSKSNRILVGSTDPAADVERLLPAEGARDMSGRLKRRSNSVLAVEVLMTTSPQWWSTATAEQQENWITQSRASLEKEWGAANVAHLELHDDETTPHLTGLIVPLDELGHLNCRAFIGGKASKRKPGSSLLSGHQTRYAEAVEDLGLRRGIMGSTARHRSIQDYYKRIAQAEQATPPDLGLPPPVFGRKKWAEEKAEAIEEFVAPLAAQAAELPVERQRRREAERTATKALEREEQARKAEEEAKAARRALADEMRALPLPDVLAALGLEEDPKEPGMWKAGPQGARTHRINVTNAKWYDHIAERGRGGAIDLVQHVLDTDFNGSLSWLADTFGRGVAASEYRHRAHTAAEEAVQRATEKRAPFTPPLEDQKSWAAVRRHLVEERAIPADLVDAAYEAGDVYAVSRPGRGRTILRNACFVQRDMSGTPTGAELKGVVTGMDGKHWSGLAPGSSKSAGVFRIGVELAHAAAVFVVESAIDALSLAARMRDQVKSFAILSTAGDNTMPETIMEGIHPHAQRVAAQDRNPAGDRQAERLGQGWKRMLPPEPFEDWNEELVAKARARLDDQAAGHVPPDDPSPDPSDPSIPSL